MINWHTFSLFLDISRNCLREDRTNRAQVRLSLGYLFVDDDEVVIDVRWISHKKDIDNQNDKDSRRYFKS